MPYTLAEAAAACGMDKSTVRRAVRSGRISGTRDDLGVWHVEPAELHRVFPPVERTEGAAAAVPLHAPPESAPVSPDTLIAELRAVIADLRQDRDQWREQAQRLALTASRASTVPTVWTPKPEKTMTWWRWLRAG
jgi:hypothetical protein